MSELLNRAKHLRAKQNEAMIEELVKVKRINEELSDAKLLGAERAKQFVELMVKHNVLPENLYLITKYRSTPTLFTKRWCDYELYCEGWVIENTSCDASADWPTERPGLMIMKDATLCEWHTHDSGPQEGWIKRFKSDIGLERLGNNMALDLLGCAIADAGIV